MSKKLKLHYFNIHARGEAIRMALHVADIPFVDYRFEFNEWPQLKSNYPFHAVPVLEVDEGKLLPQSDAILRYVGRIGNLYPDDAFEAFVLDSVVSFILQDVYGLIAKWRKAPDENKNQIGDSIKEKELPDALNLLDKYLQNNAKDQFMTNKMTIADILLFQACNEFPNHPLCPYDWEFFTEKHPHIAKIWSSVKAHPKIQGYLAAEHHKK